MKAVAQPGPTRRRRRTRLAALLLGAAAGLAIWTAAADAVAAERAYEKVSPSDKDGVDIPKGYDRAAADGDAVTYSASAAFGGTAGAGKDAQYYSERTPGGWTLEPTFPVQPVTAIVNLANFVDFSADAATGIFAGNIPTVPGSAPATKNFYRRGPGGSFELISFGQPPFDGRLAPFPSYGGASDDLRLVGFSINTERVYPVTAGPTGPAGVANVYASDGSELRLVSVLPDGTAAPSGGSIGGHNAVSDDGSRIFWSSGATPREIYVRIEGTTTQWVSESQRTPPDPSGPQPKTYHYATPDGSAVFFSSAEKLTADATASADHEDLYRYEVATGDLVDLTTGDPNGGGLLGVLGVSDDGSRVYFAATGALAPGATAGETNLYLRDGTTTTFIASLAPRFPDNQNWSAFQSNKTARVSSDGRRLLFATVRAQENGYDNAGFGQLYLYDAGDDELACVSCNPGGAPATGDAELVGPYPGGGANVVRRNLLADGTVFLSSPEPLLPAADTNGAYDVYEWQEGELALVSTGQSPSHSSFMDASADGDDVFFLTRERLVGIDTDNQVDLYDARVGGGIAAQNPPPPPPPCAGEGCRLPASPKVTTTPRGTATAPPRPPRAAPPDCSSLESKADRKAKKAKKAKRKAKKAHKKAKKLKRKAKKASGKKANKLEKKAKKAKKKAKKKKKQAKKKHKKAKQAKQKARDCKRGQG